MRYFSPAYVYAASALLPGIVSAASGGNTTIPPIKKGWVNQPDGRGTIDILWACLITIFLCTWTALHLNVPSEAETTWQIICRRSRWMLQAIIGPEFVLAFATGQKVDAKWSVDAFIALGYPQWTMCHAFYANMGGFILQPRESTPFPVNAKQLHYLIAQGYVNFPAAGEKEVWDKSKANGFTKVLTCLQIGWLVLQCIGRAIQVLPITTLELTSLSFVVCTIATYYQWANKPLDIETPTVLTISASTAEILINAGIAAKSPYRQTPLDFIDDQSPSWTTEVQPYLKFQTGPRQRPLPRFSNDRFPVIAAGPEAFILFFFTMAYAGFHVIGWNFSFPTHIEMILWRVSTCIIIGTTLVFWVCETYQDGHRLGRWDRWYRTVCRNKVLVADEENPAESIEKKPIKFIPLWEVIIMGPVSIAYAIARAYIMIEVFVGLRSQPAGVFESVNWSAFIPHF